MEIFIQINLAMTSKSFLKYVLSYLFIFGFHIVDAQSMKKEPEIISSKLQMDLKLDSIILKDYYVDSTRELKIVFTFKIDSLGEVHSAHIRWNNNLKVDDFYKICHEIESSILLKTFYDKYKDDFIGFKYVYCRYPYFSNRKN